MSLHAVSEVQGLKFFNDPLSCISDFQKTDCTKKTGSLVSSYGALLPYALHKFSLAWNQVDTQMEPFAKTEKRTLSKKKLVVCIHGLNNNPSQFKTLIDEMQKKDLSQTDIFIPRVLQRGNAKLDDMM